MNSNSLKIPKFNNRNRLNELKKTKDHSSDRDQATSYETRDQYKSSYHRTKQKRIASEKEETQAIKDTERRLRGESKQKQNTTDRMKRLGKTIEKAKIGQPIEYKPSLLETTAITDLEDRLEDKTKKNIKEIVDTRKKEKIVKKLEAQFKGKKARKELEERKQKKMSDDVTKVQALFKGRQLRKKMDIQQEPLDIPQGKTKATILSQDTTAGEKGDIPRTVLIKVDDFIANYVSKESPIRSEEISGANALILAKNRDKPIGVKKFANLLKYTNDYWDKKADGGRLTFEQRLNNNRMNFTSKEDFLNSFNIDTTVSNNSCAIAQSISFAIVNLP